MSYHITDVCDGCTACVNICPAGAISGSKKETHFIDDQFCIECGACARLCPQSSIQDPFGILVQRIRRSLWEKPEFDYKNCMGCVICVDSCPAGVIGLKKIEKHDPHPYPFLEKIKGCLSCGFCYDDCPVDAVVMKQPENKDIDEKTKRK